MVTKTISIDDEQFMKIKSDEELTGLSFSKITNQLIKLGYAYKTLLEIEKKTPKVKGGGN